MVLLLKVALQTLAPQTFPQTICGGGFNVLVRKSLRLQPGMQFLGHFESISLSISWIEDAPCLVLFPGHGVELQLIGARQARVHRQKLPGMRVDPSHILLMLKAIFYPLQGKEPLVHQLAC